MNKKESDISLIRKYLNGELNTRAMHQLEKRAQHDPFLMDAMEGYEKSGSDQHDNLEILNRRLQQRYAKKEKKIIPWNIIAIAASVIIVFTAGGLWFYNSHPSNTLQTAEAIKPVVSAPAAINKQPAAISKEELTAFSPAAIPHSKQGLKFIKGKKADNLEINEVAVASPVVNADRKAKITDTATKEDATPFNEMVVMEMADKKAKTPAAYSKAIVKRDSTPNKLLQARVPGVTVNEAGTRNSGNLLSANTLNGRVIGMNDGLPVPGASVSIRGTNKSAVTDANGRFSIPVDSTKKSKLVVNFIGYNSKEVATNNRDSLKTIALEPENNALNEMVVTGYSSQKKSTGRDSVKGVHPREGWTSFNKYLVGKAISPDGKTGQVKLTFTVEPDGSIINIKVLKGLSAATDQKAIDLVVNGPAWTGNTNGTAEKARITVKF